MAFRKLVTLSLLAVVLAVAPLQAQGRRGFDDSTTVVVVEVPVYVTSKAGQPVKGLTQGNFQVLDGRKELPIVGFEVVDLTLPADAPQARPASEIPAAARRHFLFLFDLLFSDVAAVARAREAALSFVRGQMHPADLAAVALNGARGTELVLGFSSDRRQVELALQTLGAPKLIERNRDPLGLTMVAPASTGDGPAGGRGSQAAADAVEEHLRSMAAEADRADRGQQEGKVVATTRSLADIAKLIGGIEGRKYVIYLSEGVPGDLLTGSAGLSPEDPAARLARESGEIWNVDTTESMGSSRVQNSMQAMVEEFRRADAVIQAIDVGGLRAGADQSPRSDGRESLLMMAKDTGGELFENFNDLGTAVGRIQERTAVTYLITVQPTDLKHDGKYHRLRVRLVGAEGEVFHRQGFTAPDPKAARSATAQQLDLAQEILGGGAGGELAADVLAAAFPNGDKAYVPVLIEVGGKELLAGTDAPTLPVEVYGYAIDAQGSIVDYFTQTLGLEVARVRGQLEQSGVKYFGHLALPPGSYTLRVLVRNAITGKSRLAVLPLRVPAFSGEPGLAMPLVAEAQGKWLLIPASDRPDVAYPFMKGGDAFIPAARPQVPSSGETAVQLVAHNLSQVAVSGRALAADGREVPGVSVELGAGQQGGGQLSRLQTTLKTSGVPAGDYTLVVTVTDQATGRVETSSIPIRVG